MVQTWRREIFYLINFPVIENVVMVELNKARFSVYNPTPETNIATPTRGIKDYLITLTNTSDVR